nr:MAG TPA: RloB-like protein [Caudoviricetes sp.]DAG07450.1 MAG TPA: RloB-like protein [Bacteriophage sp.]DAJ45677.1 MAG TPA: RloB-like protein [Caudoviricetes sp.]DAQ34988.1 MAG TPA: RloB-like protein [Bacteriophage sp.]DAR53330.1 MAG TPA: RloB-like protein [Caudoviricetes sp.]
MNIYVLSNGRKGVCYKLPYLFLKEKMICIELWFLLIIKILI